MLTTHSEFAVLIAFPLQQLLSERTSLLQYTYTACLWFDLQLDALNSCLFTYNTFIKLLYMFRALPLLMMMSRVNARNM